MEEVRKIAAVAIAATSFLFIDPRFYKHLLRLM
jgi:hypothetical protein